MARGADKVIEALDRFGVEYVFGHPGGAAHAHLRRAAQLRADPLRPHPARTRCDPHGRRVRPRHWQARRRPRNHLRPRCHQHHHRPAHRADGLCARHRPHRPNRHPHARQRTPFRKPMFSASPCPSSSTPIWSGDPNDIPRVMTEAFHIATTGRQGPVLVDLPKDVTQGDPFPECTADFPEKVYLPGYTWQTKPAPELLESAATLLRRSKRPLLYLGGGCIALGRPRGSQSLCRKDADARDQYPARQGGVPRTARALGGYARHARHGLRQQGRRRLRPDYVGRRALGRPDHRQAGGILPRTPKKFTSTLTQPNTAK